MFGWRTTRELEARIVALEDRVRSLTAEWERAQLDLLEVSRRAANVIRSLARREAHQEPPQGANGNGSGSGVQGVDPISQRILERRKHGISRPGSQ